MNKEMSVKEWGSHIGDSVKCVCIVTGEEFTGILTGVTLSEHSTPSLWVDYEYEIEYENILEHCQLIGDAHE